MRFSPLVAASVLAALIGAGSLLAHPAFSTSAEIIVESDGRFHGRAEFDTLAFALNDSSARIGNEPMDQLLAGPPEALAAQLAEAQKRFLHGFRVTTDAGPGTVESVEFPTVAEVLKWRDTARPVLPVVIPVEMSGHLPAGATTIAVRFPSVLDQVIVNIERPGEEPFLQPVEAGAESTPLPLNLTTPPVAPAAAEGKSMPASQAKPGAPPQHPVVGSWWQGPGFLLAVSGLILLSFLAAFGWNKLTARP